MLELNYKERNIDVIQVEVNIEQIVETNVEEDELLNSNNNTLFLL